MRKLIFFTIVAFGALVGFATAIADDWPTRIGMMLLGVLISIPIAGVAFVGTKMSTSSGRPGRGGRHESALTGEGISAEDLAANYWRDKGHPPFMNPADAIPDSQVNDPIKM
jgi:hypothetical protein